MNRISRIGYSLSGTLLLSFLGLTTATKAEGLEKPGAKVIRLALVVGANQGAGSDGNLRYAHSDATRFASVLRELGRYPKDGVRNLSGITPAKLLAALRQSALKVRALRRRGYQVIFTFYYSGHANPSELRLSGGILPYPELSRYLKSITADVRIVILDACHAGAFQAPAAKGGRPAPAFRIRLVDELSAKGEIIIASSARSEESQESERLKGSFFTTHFISGLRGAADKDGDARVTLAEGYQYAYTQTLKSTALSHTGLQHPRYKYDVTGKQELVLTWPGGADSHLSLQANTSGPFLIFSRRGQALYAEVPAEPGEAPRIALPRGEYLIQKRTAKGLLTTSLQLDRGVSSSLSESQMTLTRYKLNLGRGKGSGRNGRPGGTQSFYGFGLDLRLTPILDPNFGGAWADTARAFNFKLGIGAGVEVGLGWDRSRWWSGYFFFSYVSTKKTRRLDTLTISSMRLLLEGRFTALAFKRFRLAIGMGVGLYRSASKLNDVAHTGWIGGAHVGLFATIYIWKGFGAGFGYRYHFVHPLERDALGNSLQIGGHEVLVLNLSCRL